MLLFNWRDYLSLNKDLTATLKTQAEAEKHWADIGCEQKRLCNRKQLEVVNEFGNEIICYIPYFHYLFTAGLLFDNKVITYHGMQPFYYFCDIVTKPPQMKRYWNPSHQRNLLVNSDEHAFSFDKRWWKPPPYKEIYGRQNAVSFQFQKPTLVVHNKYNIEWDIKPFNFIKTSTLDMIFDALKDKYQIVYIRPKANIADFSYDSNTIVQEFDEDFELIRAKYSNQILTFDEILQGKGSMLYNEVLLQLYANCENYISVQGGSSYLMTYFYQKMLILHIKGDETIHDCYSGWYKEVQQQQQPQQQQQSVLQVVYDDISMKDVIKIFY
jgi:hypothetical protein